jgi:hypothetical protein
MREFEIKSELIIAASYLDPKIRERIDASDEIHEILLVAHAVMVNREAEKAWYGLLLRREAGLMDANDHYRQITNEDIVKIASMSDRKKAELLILAITNAQKQTKTGSQ